MQENYKTLIRDVLDSGITKDTRSGVTKSIFSRHVEFDLRGRTLPLVTEKYTWFHGVATELCWFLRGKTTRRWLHNHKVNIWDKWDVPYNLDRDVGSITIHRHDPSLHVPYAGDFTINDYTSSSEEDTKLAVLWRNIMRTAYDKEYHAYDPEVKVHPDWHQLEAFIVGVKTLPHWNYKQRDWETFVLSKDWYESDEYSLHSCIWISKEEEEYYTKGSCAISVDLDYDGQPDVYFLKGTDGRIPQESITRMLRNHTPRDGGRSVFGWHYEERQPREGYVYRFLPIAHGSLGPIYGYQWRHWPKYNGGEVDQIANLIEGLREDPHGRRHVVSAWNVAQLDEMALPPCHLLMQFYVGGKDSRELSVSVYQRSCDLFLGVPFNWASYALLAHIIADYVGKRAVRMTWHGGDIHLYENQWEAAKEVLALATHPFPTVKSPINYLASPTGEGYLPPEQISPGMFFLEGYRHGPKMKVPVVA